MMKAKNNKNKNSIVANIKHAYHKKQAVSGHLSAIVSDMSAVAGMPFIGHLVDAT